jgi:hypothetical protein
MGFGLVQCEGKYVEEWVTTCQLTAGLLTVFIVEKISVR